VDTNLGNTTNHDIIFGISDGTSFIGFQAHDKDNYPTISPCYIFEGDVGQNIVKNIKQGNGPLVTFRKYSSEMKIQIKPSEKWGPVIQSIMGDI